MPAFEAIATDAAGIRLPLRDWNDPASLDGNRPSRLNPIPGAPARMTIARAAVPVYLRAIVGGVVGPLDSALPIGYGPAYFSAWVAEAPFLPLGFAYVGGRSSVQFFTPPVPGKYTVGIGLANGGGAWLLHLDAQ